MRLSNLWGMGDLRFIVPSIGLLSLGACAVRLDEGIRGPLKYLKSVIARIRKSTVRKKIKNGLTRMFDSSR